MNQRRAVLPPRTECRIAIASRDEDLVRRLEHDCRRLHHRVRPPVDPAVLPAALADGTADVVLLDAQLLAGSGESLLGRLAALPEAPAVVLIAPRFNPSSAYDWLERGAADVVSRPPHLGELRLRIGRVLESRDMSAHLVGLEEEITERTRRAFADRQLVTRSPAMQRLIW